MDKKRRKGRGQQRVIGDEFNDIILYICMTLPKTKREESKIIVFTYQSCWESRWDPMYEAFAMALPGKDFDASFLDIRFPRQLVSSKEGK